MKSGFELYEDAVRLHEKPAQHARQRGDHEIARKANSGPSVRANGFGC
jgi:hypothetical protein